jgi:GTP cyclohydrolase I
VNQKRIEQGVRLILEGLEVDLSDRNYKETPKRVARMYRELFTPHRNTYAVFPESHQNMIMLRGHEVVTLCPHHLLPVRMKVFLGYIPNKQVLGLSKLARCIEDHLTEPKLQEALTDEIAQYLQLRLDPKGVACVVVGQHGCMRDRGVHTTADVVTSCMTGAFFTNQISREEFLRLAGHL